ncbi:hypothetical protein [Trueperella sp. LYQ143]|uniref:hypothetical protein n=1 Tax=Trueperella sp. LYQ143 TaxID=3391059 RepID=UPI00398398E3
MTIRKIALIVATILFSLWGIFIALNFDLIPGVYVGPPKIDEEYLVYSVTSGVNTVDVYQYDDEVCVDTYSTSEADIPDQICSPMSRKLNPSDVTLRWFTLNGDEEEVEAGHPNTTSVHILIKDGEKVILDHKESFVERFVEALNEAMNR